MRRPQIINPVFSFSDTSVTLLRTTNVLGYQFIMALGQALRLQFIRVDDIELDGQSYPCYLYDDPHTLLTHIIIDCPLEGDYDKLMLVRGCTSWDFQADLYQRLSVAPTRPDPTEYLLLQDWQDFENLRDCIFDLDTFRFSEEEEKCISTSLITNPAASVPRKTQSFLNRLRAFVALTFDTLQWHLGES